MGEVDGVAAEPDFAHGRWCLKGERCSMTGSGLQWMKLGGGHSEE